MQIHGGELGAFGAIVQMIGLFDIRVYENLGIPAARSIRICSSPLSGLKNFPILQF